MSVGVARQTGHEPIRGEVITLISNNLHLELLPRLGGSIQYFGARRGDELVEVMRSTPEGVRSSSDTSNFLMAPYPNRIRDGKFTFDGKDYQLKFPEKHAIHGDVRNREWVVESKTPSSCTLVFATSSCADVNFPFPFVASLTQELVDNTFITRCTIRNTGATRMPVGCGFHPYYPRALGGSDENVQLRFSVAGEYPFTGDVPLPTGDMIPVPKAHDFSTLRDLDVTLDHCFGGWTGPAEIYWPKSEVRIVMEASENTKHLVVYSPEGKDFFAFEPQTQMIDGVNFLEKGIETGVSVIDPGESFGMWYSLRVI